MSQKFYPTFKIGSDTRQANELLIEFSQVRVHPSLRDFMDNFVLFG